MAIITCTIRPAPGGDGPYFVVSETNASGAGTVSNVTTGIGTLAAALDQCKADTAALLSGAGVVAVTIRTMTDA